jgi:hypothetical protein
MHGSVIKLGLKVSIPKITPYGHNHVAWQKANTGEAKFAIPLLTLYKKQPKKL